MDTWLVQRCRRACFRKLLPWAVVAGAGVILILANARYFANFCIGPFVMGPAELGGVLDPTQSFRYFARVSGKRVIDTGIQEITTVDHGLPSITAEYYALDLGERLLIVKSASGHPLLVEGALDRFPSDLEARLFDTPEIRSVQSRFYPLYLDAGHPFRDPGYIALVFFLGFAGLAAWKALPFWRRWRDPASHPVMLRVAGWGDPILMSIEIENEWRSGEAVRRGNWVLTPKYLIESSFSSFNVLRFRDLLWAYKRVIRKSVNLIPTGKDYHAVFVCYGGSAVVLASEPLVNDMLQTAAQRAPWAIIGHTDALQAMFNQRMPEFCAAVEERRHKSLPSTGGTT